MTEKRRHIRGTVRQNCPYPREILKHPTSADTNGHSVEFCRESAQFFSQRAKASMNEHSVESPTFLILDFRNPKLH